MNPPMQFLSAYFRRHLSLLTVAALCVGLTWLATGCATHGDRLSSPSVGTETNRTPGAAFPVSEADNVFRTGLKAIDQRYINTVDLGAFSFAGIKGLETLEPALSIRRNGAEVALSKDGSVFQHINAPIGQDATSWARFIADVMGSANTAFPDTLGTMDPERFYKAVFNAGFAELDSFSRYATRYEAQTNRSNRRGFGGVGFYYDVATDGVTITRVLPDAPAGKAGVVAGDRLVAVDGRSVSGVSRSLIRDWLQGPKGTSVTLTLRNPTTGAERQANVTRSHIVVPSVSATIEGDMAFITVLSFNQHTTDDVAEAVSKAVNRGGKGPLKGIVLDLRGNPGGLLDQAVALSDLFMDTGPIVSTRGRHPDARQFYHAKPGDLAATTPMVVLIDGDSASSAEIAAAALQDSGRAVVVGTASYGKGTVQTLIGLPNGGEIFLTWSKYYSPSGYLPDGLGVLPSVCTSGVTSAEGSTAIIEAARAQGTRNSADAALWRASMPDNGSERAALRAVCPSEHHVTADIEPAVARAILDDPKLYAALIRSTSPSGSPSFDP